MNRKPLIHACIKIGRLFFLLLVTACLVLLPITPGLSQEIADQWRYTLKDPGEGWHQAGFDDSKWAEGNGGFGTRGTPGARVGTNWATDNIWLRKSFPLDAVPAKPALLIHHDEDAEVYINGKQVAAFEKYTTDYKVVAIEEGARGVLRAGRNLMAVKCVQRNGGQFIDVHLVDADKVPKLPLPPRDTKPFQSELITKWGEQVTPENAWTEYPRPQMQRDQWQNLNGHWDYAITSEEENKAPAEWEGKILVPFCLESKLGGVQRLLDASEALWYRRSFKSSPSEGERTLLNFEAVDYRCEVFVNGKSVGSHQGGNTPFSLDISDALRAGENELIVRVEDETEEWQLRGKQVRYPKGIWYTQVSGIWQTVWLEKVPSSFIKNVKIATDAETGMITVRPILSGGKGGDNIRIVVKDGDELVAKAEGNGAEFAIGFEGAKLWSPDSPHLYDLEISLVDGQGKEIDRVKSYAGIRTVGKVKDKDGHWRFTLNGKPIFHWGPLDQGWWPDGLLTPPSDEGMLFDIEYLKAAGFNMIRKHIKTEPRRYYYHCDRLGMMMWQDHVSGGKGASWSRLKPDPKDAEWPDEEHQQFMLELERMIATLENHPCITVWVPFNESWGQHRTVEVGEWVAKRDPSRSVNIASGGNFWPAGDVVDAHKYPHPGFPFHEDKTGRFDDFIKVIGEFGGHGYPIKGHLWDANRRNWGYGGLPQNEAEYRERYETSLKMLNDFRAQGIAGGVYTQTTDVEGEINGLMTYDRKVVKIPAKKLARLHRVLFNDSPKPRGVVLEGVKTDRKPGPVMDAETIRAGLASHDRALYIKAGWIRDPYIVLAPDGYYYLTGTTPNPGDPREAEDPYNTGLGEGSIVGYHVQLWRSRDLVDWESLGTPFSLLDGYWATQEPDAFKGEDRTSWHLWAPEVHFYNDRWHLVHTTPAPVKRGSNLAVMKGTEIKGPYEFPLADLSRGRHDPSLFEDEDGTIYLLWQNTMVAPLNKEITDFTAEPVRIDPAGNRPGPDGKPINRIGHEGATIRKIADKYVHFGTAWSTDRGRQGSYNLYYCTADKITGPYGPRRFAGRFLGHGTPFRDKDGKWWCTAFFNGNVPPLKREGIETRDLSETAQTINEQGVTIVPLEVGILGNGEVSVRAKDPAYGTIGPDEAQDFE